MTPKTLEYFAAIYAHRSLGKASAELGISQPALSKSLRALEEEIGAPLFLRHPWGMEPTKFGHTFSSHSTAIGKQFGALHRDIHALLHAQLGSVQVGMNLGAATALAPGAILSLAAIRPGIRIGLVEGLYENLVGGVLSGALDLAITTAPLLELPSALAFEPLFDDPFAVAMAKNHPMAGYALEGDASVLLSYPWVLPPDEGMLRPRIVEMFKRLGLRAPVPRVEAVSFTAVLELLCAGQFLTLQPASVLQSRVSMPHLTWIDHPSLRIERTVICVWRRDRELSPAAAELKEVILAFARKICRLELSWKPVPFTAGAHCPIAHPSSPRSLPGSKW